MRIQKLQSIALLTLLLMVLKIPAAHATTIDPLIWEQMVLDAAFVGIAECQTAGGVVASYKVIESWKGMPVGTRFNLRVSTNFWGPQFPVTFVGEKYLITAYKSHAPTRMMSTTTGTPVPLWWRKIPADFSLPLWQGRVRLPLKDKNPLDSLGSSHPDLQSFKKAVDELLSLSPERQEVRLLQSIAKKYIFSALERDQSKNLDKSVLQKLRLVQQKVEKAGSAREFATELLTLGGTNPEDTKYALGAVFSQGGGRITLDFLKSKAFKNTFWDKEDFQRILNEIEYRLGLHSEATDERVAEIPKPPTEQELSQMRTALLSGPSDERFDQAFRVLTEHDPGPVAEYLITWTNPNKSWQETDLGYIIGSYFAAVCGKDREVHLLKLLQAQDPFIRVAGAVYLTFENPTLGMTKLEELAQLPGDPGVWAALNLARRGRHSAVPRLLEVFATSGQYGHMSGVPHENLQLRVQILLSNSAAASNLPRLTVPEEPGYGTGEESRKKFQEGTYRYYVEWWRSNQEKAQLSDPWLKVLEQQKID